MIFIIVFIYKLKINKVRMKSKNKLFNQCMRHKN